MSSPGLTRPAAVRGAPPAPALALQGVTRQYAGRSVWAPLDLRLEPATVSVVTGANGSGKTTLLRLAAGLLRPSTGSRRCGGVALYVRAGAGLRSAQTVQEAVADTAGLTGRRDAAAAAVASAGLVPLASRRLGTLSAGERVRATLAAAVAAQPAVLCLDEPTGALDDDGTAVLVRLLEGLRAAGCAVLVASHQPATLLPTADAHLHLAGGRLVAR